MHREGDLYVFTVTQSMNLCILSQFSCGENDKNAHINVMVTLCIIEYTQHSSQCKIEKKIWWTNVSLVFTFYCSSTVIHLVTYLNPTPLSSTLYIVKDISGFYIPAHMLEGQIPYHSGSDPCFFLLLRRKSQGWVMEFHDICPSNWADFCQYRHISLLFHGWTGNSCAIINPLGTSCN